MADAAQDNLIKAASQSLESWIARQYYQGWDPFDALNSPLISKLTFGNRRLGQIWVQLLKRSPVNLRPVLGVSKGYNPKGVGLFLAAYWRKYLLGRQERDLEQVRFFLQWLQDHVSRGYHGACWGYNFAWPNRGFFAPAGTPTIVNTAFIGLAFCDLWKLEDEAESGLWDTLVLHIARSACDFILRDLHSIESGSGEICFSYTPLDRRCVHNANILGACLLAVVAAQTGEEELKRVALASTRYTARRQRSDGSWLYGEGALDQWVDNFHTGYILTSLRIIQNALGTREFESVIQKGYSYWKERFFLTDGTPKYYPAKVYPIDIHSAAQAILTYLAYTDIDPGAYSLAKQLALWTIQNMQAPQGYFIYQKNRLFSIRIPYMRWSQAWMLRALIELEWMSRRENLD